MIRSDGSLGLVPRIAIVIVVVVLAATLIAIPDYIGLTFAVSFSVVGALLAIRRPRNPVGWLLLVNAAGFVGTSLPGPNVDAQALLERRAPIDLALLAWFGGWASAVSWLCYAGLAMVFPTGELPSGRAGRVARIALVAGLVVLGLSMVAPMVSVYPNGGDEVRVPNPFGILPVNEAGEAIQSVGLLVLLGTIAVGIALLLRRYRRAEGVTRLQIRWVLTAIAITLLAILVGIILTVLTGSALGGLVWVPAILAYPTVPIAMGIAIFRYRLYEIDRIVNRAIVYSSVTAILAGIVAGATAVSQKVLNDITGGSEFGTAAIALVVVTLYTPLRKRVEAFVDRYFKYEQRQFGGYREELRRVAALVDPARAAERLAHETLGETRATGVAVLARDGALLASAGEWPAETAARISIDGTSPLAAILIGPRSDGRPHARRVIEALASVATLADVVARAGVLGDIATSRVDLATSATPTATRPSEAAEAAQPRSSADPA